MFINASPVVRYFILTLLDISIPLVDITTLNTHIHRERTCDIKKGFFFYHPSPRLGGNLSVCIKFIVICYVSQG